MLVENNNFTNNGNAANEGSIYLTAGATYNNVTNNTFHASSNYAIYFASAGDDNNNVWKNKFYDKGILDASGGDNNYCPADYGYGNYYDLNNSYYTFSNFATASVLIRPDTDCGPTPNANTIVVNTSAVDSWSFGGTSAVYDSINEGLGNVDSADRVNVTPGSSETQFNTQNTYVSLAIYTPNITLDCGGANISGMNDGVGFYSLKDNFTIKDCGIKRFDNGIYIDSGADGSHIVGNVIMDNHERGIYLPDANTDLHNISHNQFINNTHPSGTEYDLFWDNSGSNNTISYNNFSSENYANIEIEGTSHYNIIDNNRFYVAETYHIFFDDTSTDATYNIISNNYLNGSKYQSLYLEATDYNLIEHNNFTFNGNTANEGSIYTAGTSTYNNITNNSFWKLSTQSTLSIKFSATGDDFNYVWNNNFYNNGSGWYIDDAASGNFYNWSVYGNYWDNFDTAAEGCSNIGRDGVCDASLIVDDGGVAVDYLPRTTAFGWEVAPNITAINPQRNAVLSYDTKWVWVNITTDVSATCQYNDTIDFTYGTDGTNYPTSNNTYHALNKSTPLGQTYTIYTKCQDTNGITNYQSYEHSFTVNNSMNVSVNTGPSTVNASSTAYAYGYLNFTNGTGIPNNPVDVYVDGTRETNDLGDGSDGALTVSTYNQVVNNYSQLLENISSSSTKLALNDSSAFSVGEEVLIIQMQNRSVGNVGQYEFATISSISGNNLTLSSGIVYDYYSGIFNSTTAYATQVVRVPHYTDVTVQNAASTTAKAWDGYIGGILVFRTQDYVNVFGSINVTGKGYRSGAGGSCTGIQPTQGESIRGFGDENEDNRNDGGGGSGSSSALASSGGGGGHGTGGNPGNANSNGFGINYSYFNLTKIMLGSGGGGGGCDTDTQTAGGDGGAGGGIVMIFGNNISTINNGSIVAGGEGGISTIRAAGSGGAGGSIHLGAKTINVGVNNVTTIGGSGGTGAGDASGSSGGKGTIRFDFVTISGTSNPAQEFNGTFNSYATDSSGLYNFTFTTPSSEGTYTVIANSTYEGYYAIASSSFSVSSADSTAPGITIVYPWNQTNLTAGTTWTWVNITTDENATCQYNDTNSGFTYETDGTNLTKMNNTYHYFNYSNYSNGLVNETVYTIYYKCNDSNGNVNSQSVAHQFTVNKTPDLIAPGITLIGPSNNSELAVNAKSTWINITTNESGYCEFNDTNDFTFGEDGTNLSTLDNRAHFYNYTNHSNGLVNNGAYVLYYRCNDSFGNENSVSEVHKFTVGESEEISSCQALTTVNGKYKLTTSLYNDTNCFEFQANGIQLDCQGNTITGNATGTGDTEYYGINITHVDSALVRRCIITNYTSGIYLQNSSFNTLTNLTIVNNSGYGIYFSSSLNNTVNSSSMEYNPSGGVGLQDSHNNTFFNNSFLNPSFGGGDVLDISFESGGSNNNNNNMFYLNVFSNSTGFNNWNTNAGTIILNNSNYGNRWTSQDEPRETCYDADADGICDDSYSFGSGPQGEVSDYLPIRKGVITAGISLALGGGSLGAANYLDSNYNGYIPIQGYDYYQIDIINNQQTSDNITINYTDYNGINTILLNQSSVVNLGAYSIASIIFNMSAANKGDFIMQFNATTNDSDYNYLMNITTRVIESLASSPDWETNLTGVSSPSLTTGDIDNDGDYDLIVIGTVSAPTSAANVYINEGDTFNVSSAWSANITDAGTGSAAMADFNNDGWLDLVIAGEDENGVAVTNIYINNGTNFVQNITWENNITPKLSPSIVVGDIDLDGKIDMMLTGATNNNPDGVQAFVYINNGTSFNENYDWQKNLTGLYGGIAHLADINNDTYLDLFMLGIDENSVSNISIYINNQTTLEYNSNYSLGFRDCSLTSSTYGDFNNDYLIDMAIQCSEGSNYLDIYFNNKSHFVRNDSWSSGLTINQGNLFAGDYNNNGYIDLVSTQLNSGGPGDSNVQFFNNTGRNFTQDTDYEKFISSDISSMQSSSALFVDMNNDSNLDYVVLGDNAGNNAYVYLNKRVSNNTIPNAPTSFNQGYGSGFDINWTGASDSEGGIIYYNVRIGTSSEGNDVVSGKYGIGSDPGQGMFGNMITGNSLSLNISDTNYYWSVQAIDSSLAASAWSAEQNYIVTNSISSCQVISNANQNYELTQDAMQGDSCFTITASNIELDCQGNSIRGNASDVNTYYGINISKGTTNVNITNCTVLNYSTGVYLYDVNVSTFDAVNLTNNTYDGMIFEKSHNNTVKFSTIQFNSNRGIEFDGCHNNEIYNNTIVESEGVNADINFYSNYGTSDNNKFYGNIFDAFNAFTSVANANNIVFNNSYYGNLWKDFDEPVNEYCYDTDNNGICDDIYNVSSKIGGGTNGYETDYLPIRSTSITPGITLVLDASDGLGQNNDSNANGYVGINEVGTYYVYVYNNQQTSDNITINYTDYTGAAYVLNQSSILNIPSYGNAAFALNVSDSSLGQILVGLNVTTNDSEYFSLLNLTTDVVEAFVESSSWGTNLIGLGGAAMLGGDIDNDNDNDLIMMGGINFPTIATVVYINDGSTFNVNTSWSWGMSNLSSASGALADFNNDNNLDLVVMGTTNDSEAATELYTNNGTTLKYNSTWTTDVTRKQTGSIAVGDIDLDGDVDMVLCGADESDGSGTQTNVYINSGSAFSESTSWQGNLTQMYNGDIILGDLNNDTYLDLFMIGTDEDSNQIAEVYISNGTGFNYNVTFSSNLRTYQSGSYQPYATFVDMDNDNDLDLVVQGNVGGTGFDVYFNNVTHLVYNASWTSGLTIQNGPLYPGDYNNDGTVDILSVSTDSATQEIILYNNTGNSLVVDVVYDKLLTNVGSGSGFFMDVDNDNNLDMITSGTTTGTTKSAAVYLNKRSSNNNAPIAPDTVTSDYTTGLDINWTAGTDTEGGSVYYNVKVGTSSGRNDIVSGKYGFGNRPSQGMFGNRMLNKKVILNISNQTYYWSVQAIDSSLKTSSFSTESNTLETTPPIISIVYPVNGSFIDATSTWTLLNISTNEVANCQYNDTSDFTFGEDGTDMITFGTTNKTHYVNLTGLVHGTIYTIYYRCNDTLANKNIASTVHTVKTKSHIGGCSNLTIENEEYVLNGSLTNSEHGKCMNIFGDSIILDCQGNTIDGQDTINSYGVFINTSSATIKNCTITDYYYGIYANNSASSNQITKNNLSSNQMAGIYFEGSPTPFHNNITNNNFELQENNSGYDIYVSGDNYTILSNNFSSTSVQYNINLNQFSYDNTISSNRFTNSGNYSICIGNNTEGTTINDNFILNAYDYGIYLNGSDVTLIRDNNITNAGTSNLDSAILMNNSATFNNITNNSFGLNNEYALVVQMASDNIIWENNFMNNQTAFFIFDNDINYYNLSSSGNYWEAFSSLWCNDADNDGFCDSQYFVEISGSRIDYHVYMNVSGWISYIPIVTEYNATLGTNFTAIENLTAVRNMSLATTQGKIKWTYSEVNVESMNFDTHVEIGEQYIVLNTTQLSVSMNTTADVTIEDVGCSGFKPLTDLIYTEGDVYSSKADVQAYGKSCPPNICSNIVCEATQLNFTVAHFTGYSAGGNANLTVYDDYEGLSVPISTNVSFYANYTNATGDKIPTASCNITFEDNSSSSYQMTEDQMNYNYSKSFSTSETYQFNVSCYAPGYTTLTANDTISVSGSTPISSCQQLGEAGTTYELSQNVNADGDCFNISTDNITLDCAGYEIIGNYTDNDMESFEGIISNFVENITIINCTIHNFTRGINIEQAEKTTITNSNITNNSQYGIYMYITSNITIKTSDFAKNDEYSVYMQEVNYTFIHNNTFDGKPSTTDDDLSADLYIAGLGEGYTNLASYYGWIYANTFNNYSSVPGVCINGHYFEYNYSGVGNRWLDYDEPMDYAWTEGYTSYSSSGTPRDQFINAFGCFDADDDKICDNAYSFFAMGNSDIGDCYDDFTNAGSTNPGFVSIGDYHPLRKLNIVNNFTVILSSERGAAEYSDGTGDDAGIDGYIPSGIESITSSIGNNYTIYLVNNNQSAQNFTTNCYGTAGFDTDGLGQGCELIPHFTGSADDEGIAAYTAREITMQIDSTIALNRITHNFSIESEDNTVIFDKNISSNIIQGFVNDPYWTKTGGNYGGAGEETYYIGGSGTVMAAGDINNDGVTDAVVISGAAPTASTNTAYLIGHVMISDPSTGQFTYTEWASNLTNVSHGSMMLADINNDNWLDLIVAGSTHQNGNANDTVYIYINDQSNTLEQDLTWSSNITTGSQPSIITGDIDLDGDLDLVMMGSTDAGDDTPISQNPTLVYLNTGTTFEQSDVWSANLPPKDNGCVFLVDINNDHYMDLIQSGTLGSGDTNYDPMFYINNATTFIQNQTWGSGMLDVDVATHNNIAFGDLNNDNWMDAVVLGGWTYINNKSTLVRDTSWDDNMTGDITFLGDYNHDGFIDLLTDRQDSSGNTVPATYQGSGSGFSRDNLSNKFMTMLNTESAIFGDFNNDSNLDIFAAEEKNIDDGNDYNELLLFLNLHNSSNQAPGVVSNFSANYAGGINVSWHGASDPEGGIVYYNLKIGTTSGGNEVMSSAYGYSADPTQGIYGNMQAINSTLFNVDQTATFYLGVQAVDTGLERGNWTEVSITYVAGVGVVQVGGSATAVGAAAAAAGILTKSEVEILLENIDPATLGLETITVGDVTIDVVAEETVTQKEEATEEAIEQVLEQAVEEEAIEEIKEIQAAVQQKTYGTASVSKSMEVYNITANKTKKSIEVTLIKTEIQPPKKVTKFKLIEAIPKSIAETIDKVKFIGILPIKILQADPIVKFYFEKIEKDEIKEIKYLVHKRVDKLTATSIAVYENIVDISDITTEGLLFNLVKGDASKLVLDEKEYELIIEEIKEKGIVIKINEANITIKIGEIQEIDVDNDGIIDFKVELLSIKDGKAEIRYIGFKEVEEEEEEVEIITEKPVLPFNKKSLYQIIGMISVLVLVFLILGRVEREEKIKKFGKVKKKKGIRKKRKIRKLETRKEKETIRGKRKKDKKKKISERIGAAWNSFIIIRLLKQIISKIRQKRKIQKHMKTVKKLETKHKKISKKIDKIEQIHKIKKPKKHIKRYLKYKKIITSILMIMLIVLLVLSLAALAYYFVDYSQVYSEALDLGISLKDKAIELAVESEEVLASSYYGYHIVIGLIGLVILILLITIMKLISHATSRILNKIKKRKEKRKKEKIVEKITKKKQEKRRMLRTILLLRRKTKEAREKEKQKRKLEKEKQKIKKRKEKLRNKQEKRRKRQEKINEKKQRKQEEKRKRKAQRRKDKEKRKRKKEERKQKKKSEKGREKREKQRKRQLKKEHKARMKKERERREQEERQGKEKEKSWEQRRKEREKRRKEEKIRKKREKELRRKQKQKRKLEERIRKKKEREKRRREKGLKSIILGIKEKIKRVKEEEKIEELETKQTRISKKINKIKKIEKEERKLKRHKKYKRYQKLITSILMIILIVLLVLSLVTAVYYFVDYSKVYSEAYNLGVGLKQGAIQLAVQSEELLASSYYAYHIIIGLVGLGILIMILKIIKTISQVMSRKLKKIKKRKEKKKKEKKKEKRRGKIREKRGMFKKLAILRKEVKKRKDRQRKIRNEEKKIKERKRKKKLRKRRKVLNIFVGIKQGISRTIRRIRLSIRRGREERRKRRQARKERRLREKREKIRQREEEQRLRQGRRKRKEYEKRRAKEKKQRLRQGRKKRKEYEKRRAKEKKQRLRQGRKKRKEYEKRRKKREKQKQKDKIIRKEQSVQRRQEREEKREIRQKIISKKRAKTIRTNKRKEFYKKYGGLFKGMLILLLITGIVVVSYVIDYQGLWQFVEKALYSTNYVNHAIIGVGGLIILIIILRLIKIVINLIMRMFK